MNVYIDNQKIEANAGETLALSVVAEGQNLSYQWNKDDAEIADATSSTYTIASVAMSDAGVYTCRVSNSAGSVLSDAAVIEIIDGIEEFISNFYAAPNPTKDIITINMDILQAGDVGIFLIDITGRELMQIHNAFEDAGTFTKTFSLKGLPLGIYYLKISHNGNVRMEKVIRN